jgi:hypothetical protein
MSLALPNKIPVEKIFNYQTVMRVSIQDEKRVLIKDEAITWADCWLPYILSKDGQNYVCLGTFVDKARSEEWLQGKDVEMW